MNAARSTGLRAAWSARRPARGSQRGTFTLAVVFWALMTLVLAAFVVDGGLSVSQQVARAVANNVDTTNLRDGDATLTIPFNNGQCTAQDISDADAVLRDDGLPATDLGLCEQDPTEPTRVVGQFGTLVDVVLVSIRFTYHPIFLGMFYTGALSVTAQASAYPEPGI
jgi:hypothetical protein